MESSDLEINENKNKIKSCKTGSQTFEPSRSVGPFNSRDDPNREQAVDSITNKNVVIEDLIMKGYSHLEEYKKEAEDLREQIQRMLNDLLEQNQDIQDSIDPAIMDSYKYLKEKIKTQKDENELLYKHLLSIKKETNDVQAKFESWNFEQ